MKSNHSASVFDALAQISDTIFPQIGVFYAPAGAGAALLHAVGYRGTRDKSSSSSSSDELEREIRMKIMDRVLRGDRKAGCASGGESAGDNKGEGEDEGKGGGRGGPDVRGWHQPLLQFGVLRTNCVDCLDRTNVAQFR